MMRDAVDAVSAFFDEGMLLAIATFLILKALVFRRVTAFGRAISRSNVALAVAFYGSALGMHFPFFRTELWRWSTRGAVLITTICAVTQVVKALGGWRAVGREARIAAAEFAWEVYRLPATIYDHCCSGYTLSRSAWTRAGVRRRIVYAGIALAILVVIIALAIVFYETHTTEEARDYATA